MNEWIEMVYDAIATSRTVNRFGKVGLAGLLVVLTTGALFAKSYKAPKPGEPAATLVLVRPASDSFMRPSQSFHAFENAECSKTPRGGFLGALTDISGSLIGKVIKDDKRKDFSVAAGEPLFLRAKAVEVLDSRKRSFTTNRCTNLISFTPMEGRTYEATQLFTSQKCLLVVTDADSKLPPDDFKQVPISGECHD